MQTTNKAEQVLIVMNYNKVCRCKYIEQAVADSQQGVVLKLGCWLWG
jgi:hypothetical protein